MTIIIKFGLLHTTASHYNQPSLTVYWLDRKNGQKLPKLTHLTFKMTPGGVENGAIGLAVLKISYIDPRSCL